MSREPVEQPDLLQTLQPAAARNFTLPGDTLNAEMWLAGRMREHSVDTIFEGVTDPDVRKARFRQRIVEGGLQLVMACHAEDGRKAENYSQAFERIYREPLELDSVKRRRKATPGAKLAAEDSESFSAESSGPPELRHDLDDDSIEF